VSKNDAQLQVIVSVCYFDVISLHQTKTAKSAAATTTTTTTTREASVNNPFNDGCDDAINESHNPPFSNDATGNDQSQTEASFTLHSYWQQKRDYTIAHVGIHISPTTQAFSSSATTPSSSSSSSSSTSSSSSSFTVHRIILPDSAVEEQEEASKSAAVDAQQQQQQQHSASLQHHSAIKLQVHLSLHCRSLLCVIPIPNCNNSNNTCTVLFQLKRPTASSLSSSLFNSFSMQSSLSAPLPPLPAPPSYIESSSATTSATSNGAGLTVSSSSSSSSLARGLEAVNPQIILSAAAAAGAPNKVAAVTRRTPCQHVTAACSILLHYHHDHGSKSSRFSNTSNTSRSAGTSGGSHSNSGRGRHGINNSHQAVWIVACQSDGTLRAIIDTKSPAHEHQHCALSAPIFQRKRHVSSCIAALVAIASSTLDSPEQQQQKEAEEECEQQCGKLAIMDASGRVQIVTWQATFKLRHEQQQQRQQHHELLPVLDEMHHVNSDNNHSAMHHAAANSDKETHQQQLDPVTLVASSVHERREWLFSISCSTTWQIESRTASTAASSSLLISRVRAMTWIDSCTLACIHQQEQNERNGNDDYCKSTTPKSMIRVWSLHKSGKVRTISSSCLQVTKQDLYENAHATFVIGNGHDGRNAQEPGEMTLLPSPLTSTCALEYDVYTGCLAISSFVSTATNGAATAVMPEIYPFVCIWNWKSNVQGLLMHLSEKSSTLFNNNNISLLSHLFFATDFQGRRKLVHITGQRYASPPSSSPEAMSFSGIAMASSSSSSSSSSSPLETTSSLRKDLFTMAVLSPPNSRCNHDFGSTLLSSTSLLDNNSNSLLLSASSVSYPLITNNISASYFSSWRHDYQVEWRESSMPMDYIATHGAPRIAAIGSRLGRSIAVASRCGMCVLECPSSSLSSSNITETAPKRRDGTTIIGNSTTSHRPRWFRFGNETEEASFCVLAITWWEGNHTATESILSDDLLLAVVQEVSNNNNSSHGSGEKRTRRYLAVWSPRQFFDFAHQLLQPSLANNNSQTQANLHDASERDDDTDVGMGNENNKDRHDDGHNSSHPWGIRLPDTFSSISLQILAEPMVNKRTSLRRKAVVLLTDAANSPCTHYGIYQLEFFRLATKNAAATMTSDKVAYAGLAKCACLGNIGSPTAGIFLAGASFAFSFRQRHDELDTEQDEGFAATIGVIRPFGGGVDAMALSCSSVGAVGEIVSSRNDSLSDTEVLTFRLSDIIISETPFPTYVWTIQMANGRLVSWSVPSVCTKDQQALLMQVNTDPRVLPGSFDLPMSVHPTSMLLGTACLTGSTSTWMQGSSSATRSELTMASVPGSWFGCVLGAGQRCRKLHRQLGEKFETEIFRPDFLEHNIFGPGDFAVFTPAFVTSLFKLFINSTLSLRLCDDDNDDGSNYNSKNLDLVADHLRRRLESYPYGDTVIMALRLLVLRCVEKLVADSSKKRSGHDGIGSRSYIMFASVVDVIRRLTRPLQFASLFVEVGRQVEPSCYRYLFPLPGPPTDDNGYNGGGGLGGGGETLRDLLNVALAHGSVSLSVAALPLLEDRSAARSICASIFHHCLSRCISQSGNLGYGACGEEIRVLSDIFRYGLKLEDPDECEDDANDTSNDLDIATATSDDNDDFDNDNETEKERGYSLLCVFFGRSKPKQRTPRNGDGAASSFIGEGFSDDLIDNHLIANGIPTGLNTQATMTHRNSKRGSDAVEDEAFCFETVAGVTARQLLACILERSQGPHWKQAALVTTLVLGDNLSGLRTVSKSDLTKLLEETPVEAYPLLLPEQRHDTVEDNSNEDEDQELNDLVMSFMYHLTACRYEIGSQNANGVLSLLLVLLARRVYSADLQGEIIPSLIFATIVAASTAGRLADLLENMDLHDDDDDEEDLPWMLRCYLEACRQLG
jgi:hypothetical protein